MFFKSRSWLTALLFGGGYYGFSFVPGLIPTEVPVPGDTVDDRQLDRTHTTIFVASDSWKLRDRQTLTFSGFFRTYSLTLRSDFGDRLIQQSEFRNVAGANASYIYRIRKTTTLLAGIDLRRDARDLDLKHADANGIFQPVTSNDLTLGFIAPFASIDGSLSPYLHYDLGLRREEVNMNNLDKVNPGNSFNKLAGVHAEIQFAWQTPAGKRLRPGGHPRVSDLSNTFSASETNRTYSSSSHCDSL